MPSPNTWVDCALVAMHGVHHAVQGGIQEPLGGFGVEVGDELGGAFQVGKQHRDLLALAFQGTPSGENLLGQMGGCVGQWRTVLGAGWWRGDWR
jgi:hypothetical protein